MKHLKMLALAAVAAGALMAFVGAGTASATVLCSTTVEPCPAGQKWPANTLMDMSVPSGNSINWVNTSNEELDTCSGSTIKGPITSAGSSTTTVTSTVEELTWGGCTFPTATVTKGKLEVHRIAGTHNGTVTADGTFEWTFNTVFFGTCIYGFTAGNSIGDLTEGKPAVFHYNAVVEKFSGSAFACPSTGKLTGTFEVTSPSNTTLSVQDS